MRAILALAFVGLALLFLGGWVLEPTPDTGPPGERHTGHLYVLYAGVGSLALALLLLIRQAWRRDPSASGVIFFFAIGFAAVTLGAGLVGRGDPTGPIVFVSGLALVTLAIALGMRRVWKRSRSLRQS